jgi:hypothetical protein
LTSRDSEHESPPRERGVFRAPAREQPPVVVENGSQLLLPSAMGHEYQDRVSLSLAHRVASQLPERPEWLLLARDNLARAIQRNPDDQAMLHACAEWQAILERPIDQIIATLTAETDEGQRLRQNSPFAGTLPPHEVWEIKRRFLPDQDAA